MPTASASSSFDSSRLPVGDDGWDQFLAWASSAGIDDENDWVEVKDVDPVSRSGGAKIAKYVLGVANRHPYRAARHLGGHAVMFIGVGPGHARGIATPDLLEVQKKINVYLGPDGPHWELKRIPVEAGNQVLAVVVDPPRWGDPMHVCVASGDGVQDGHIYHRYGGETKQAKSAEITMLRLRASKTAGAAPSLSVALTTPVSAYAYDSDAIRSAIAGFERGLLWDLPSEVKKRDEQAERARREAERRRQSAVSIAPSLAAFDMFKGYAAAEKLSGFRSIPNAGMVGSNDWMRRVTEIPEARTEEQFKDEVVSYIDVLKERVRDDDCRDWIIRQIAPEFGVRVLNESDDFIEHLTVEVHIEGPIEALDSALGTTAKYDDPVPRAPRPWGPRKKDPLGYPMTAISAQRFGNLHPPSAPAPNTASARTTGSVTLTLDIEGLRARESITITGDEVLVVSDPSRRTLTATWTARARNITGVLDGAITIEVNEPVDITAEFGAALKQSKHTGSLYIPEAEDD